MSEQTPKRVYILRGPSGAGKTTWTNQLSRDLGLQVTVCSADHFFERVEKNIAGPDGEMNDALVYDFDVKKLPEAHQRCMQAFLLALLEEHPVVVVDNTNERRWEYQNYELAARLAGYEIQIVDFIPRTIDEVRACAARNRHGVPLSVVATKAAAMERDTRATQVRIHMEPKR